MYVLVRIRIYKLESIVKTNTRPQQYTHKFIHTYSCVHIYTRTHIRTYTCDVNVRQASCYMNEFRADVGL